MKEIHKDTAKTGYPPEKAEVLFRQSLRALTSLENVPVEPDSLDRLLRALLTIGCILKFPRDAALVRQLYDAEMQVDIHDLSLEDPNSGEIGMILPSDNLSKLQHSVVQWLIHFQGKAHQFNQEALEKYLLGLQSSSLNMLARFSVEELLTSERKLDETDATAPHAVELLAEPLFRIGKTYGKSPHLTLAEAILEASNVSFWLSWYQSFHEGDPLDWGLQRRIALIEDTIWDAGPEAVAEKIERIKAEMLSERLPMAETIELTPDTGKFRSVPIQVENAHLMTALLSQIEDVMEDCIGSHNGLAQHSGDVKRLNRVLTKYRDDPQNAELTLTRVATSLRAQLHDSRELPDNEDNLALLNAVEEGVRGIRANHLEVAANREQLARQAFKALSAEDKRLLEDALPMLEEISEPELAEDFSADIPELINDALRPLPDGAAPLPGLDAATRVFSRVSKMALLRDQFDRQAKKGAKAFDSDVAKSIRLAGLTVSVTGGAASVLYAIVQIGLRVLGVL